MKKPAIAVAVLAFLFLVPRAQAGDWTADRKGVYRFQDCSLTADHVTYSPITKIIQGTGHAKLVLGPRGDTVLGYQITIPHCTANTSTWTIVVRRKPADSSPKPLTLTLVRSAS